MISTTLRTAGTGGPWNRVQMAAQAMNQHAARMRSGNRKDGDDRREDRLQLNPLKQAQSIIDHLMDQKQNLIEQKNQLIADTLSGGGDMDSIRSLVALYDEQINTIETQISQTMKDMVERQLDEKEEEEGKGPETKEEQQIQQMNRLSNASMDYEQVNEIHSAYDQKKRDASIMAMEIKLDGSRPGGAPHGKIERLAETLQEADSLYTDAMKGYVDLNVDLKEEEKEEIQEGQQLSAKESREKAEEAQGDSLIRQVQATAEEEENQEDS